MYQHRLRAWGYEGGTKRVQILIKSLRSYAGGLVSVYFMMHDLDLVSSLLVSQTPAWVMFLTTKAITLRIGIMPSNTITTRKDHHKKGIQIINNTLEKIYEFVRKIYALKDIFYES